MSQMRVFHLQDPTRDPRCPYCGRAVLGMFVQGVEGRYHLACTQPPAELTPFLPNIIPSFPVVPTYPQPQVTCDAPNLNPCI